MDNSIKIKRLSIPSDKRILVTSDIHGHTDHLKRLLEMADFSEDDLLIIVGDLIEKGPDSLGTLKYVMDLQHGGNVITLTGNVDFWRMQMLENIKSGGADEFYKYLEFMRGWKGTSIFDEMTRELGFTVSSPEQLTECVGRVEEHFKDELAFLKDLPTVLESENFIFVHSGLPENGLNDADKLNVYDVIGRAAFLREGTSFEKFVVVGHYPVALYNDKYPNNTPIIDLERRIISIDGGCGLKADGQLNLLIIPNAYSDGSNITHIYYDTCPSATALTDQAESEDSLKIGYLDNRIEVITEENELALVRHITTGRELWVLRSYLHNGDTKCDDCTDYIMPVNKGDVLSLICETSKGYIVKKNGISGWYYGEVERN